MGKLSQRRIFGGGDRYRVLLLDHERHTETQGMFAYSTSKV